MHTAIAALIQWLPRLFYFVLLPAAGFLLLLSINRRTRSASALGLLAIATIALFFLSIDVAAILYVFWGYGRMALDMLLDLGPAVTVTLLTSILHGSGARPVDFLSMLVTAAGTSVVAIALRGRPRAITPIAGPPS